MKKFVLLLLISLLAAGVSFGQDILVLVPLQAGHSRLNARAEAVTELIENTLTEMQRFNVLDAVEMDQMLNADFIIRGSLSERLEERLEPGFIMVPVVVGVNVNLELFDVNTGIISNTRAQLPLQDDGRDRERIEHSVQQLIIQQEQIAENIVARQERAAAWEGGGICIGFGIGPGITRTTVDNNSATTAVGAVALFVDFRFWNFFSVGLRSIGLGGDYGGAIGPSILAGFGRESAFNEFYFNLGFTPGMGFTFGGNFGVNVGRGVIFTEVIASTSSDTMDVLGTSITTRFTNILVFFGYKLRVGTR